MHFIGALPETRKSPERITQKSISNFMRTFSGNEGDIDNLSFIEITLDQRTGEITLPEPSIKWIWQKRKKIGRYQVFKDQEQVRQ